MNKHNDIAPFAIVIVGMSIGMMALGGFLCIVASSIRSFSKLGKEMSIGLSSKNNG